MISIPAFVRHELPFDDWSLRPVILSVDAYDPASRVLYRVVPDASLPPGTFRLLDTRTGETILAAINVGCETPTFPPVPGTPEFDALVRR